MPRGLGLIIFSGLGYVLVYASVANSGRFATSPWAGLQEDAYTGDRSTAVGPDTGAVAPEPTWRGPTSQKDGATLVAGRTRSPRRRRAQTGTLV